MSDPSSSQPTPRGATRRQSRRRARRRTIVLVVVLLVLVGGISATLVLSRGTSSASKALSTVPTTAPAPTTTTTQAPGPGFVAGKVTAIGDSVMIDYQQPLESALPGITVDAAVSRQWSTGIDIVNQLKAADQLGATVIIALSTNGPITANDFAAMQSALSGASRVIYVNTHVDRDWQDPNNAVLAAGVAASPNAKLVDWNALASQNPSWFGSDGTHLAIDGPGTSELAAQIAAAVS